MSIDSELLKTIEEKISKKSAGIFYLGQKAEAREVIFDGSFFCLKKGYEPHWFPTSLGKTSRLTSNQLDSLLARWYSETPDLDKLLEEFDFFDDRTRSEIISNHGKEEILESFLLAADSHLFEAGSPQNNCTGPKIAAAEFKSLLDQQLETTRHSNEIFPSPLELLVLSPSGVSARDQNESWIFSRIAMLVDGFRTIQEIKSDSPFSPSTTHHQLTVAAEKGWLFKTTFPELKRISFDGLEESARVHLQQRLEIATTMAADPVVILEKLLQLHQSAGDQENTRATELRIVEAYRCARHPEAAIERLEKIVSEDPGRQDARTLLVEVLVDLGEELLKGSQPDEGRRRLRSAISLSDDDQIRLRLITSHETPALQIREGMRIASRLHRESKRDRAISIINGIEALHPDSEPVQRAKIDFLIDHGELEVAEKSLEKFTARLAASGSLQQARKMVETIDKVRRRKDPQGKRWTHGQRALRRVRQLVLLLPFLIFCALVTKTEFALQEVIANADSMPPEKWKQHASGWLRWLPPGPWKTGLENAAKLVEERSIDQKRTYSSAAREAILRARNARILGNLDEMNQELQKAIQFGAGEESKLLARKWQQEDQQALDLRRLLDLARQQGDFSRTRRLALELLKKHPSNEASVGITIPIQIDSADQTYLITETGTPLALPRWIEIKPFGSRIVVLQKEGRRSEFSISAQGPETVLLPAP